MSDTISNILTYTAELVTNTFFTEKTGETGLVRVVNLSNSSEIAIVMIFLFLLLGIAIRNTNYTHIKQIKEIFGSTKYSQKFNAAKENSLDQIIIWTLTLLGFSFFFALSFDYFNNLDTLFLYYRQTDFVITFFAKTAVNFVAIGVLLWLQKIFFKFVAWLFSFEQNSVELVLRSFTCVVKPLGITLLIISFFYIYSPDLWQKFILYFGFAIGCCALLMLIIYYIGKFFSKFVSLFYFFLYLCALEILPILILKKLIIGAYKMV